jgi:nucleotide-binding universal stress UspA family protein
MYKHILAATDFSDLGGRALQKASELAISLGAKLTLVHVMVSEESASPMYAEHEVRAHVERLEEKLRSAIPPGKHIQIGVEVRVGQPAQELLAAMQQHGADLIVVSSNGEKGFTRWLLGSVTDRVLRGCERDVLVVT